MTAARPLATASRSAGSIALLLGACFACAAPPSRGQDPAAVLRDARDLEARGQVARALALYGQVLDRDPEDADARYLRANALYRSGRVAEALEDFDRYAELVPSREPYLWQRGIAQYQAGRYAECADQFVIHRTVNPADVENAAWHFLCAARARGLDAARDELLPVGPDARTPMAEVYALFSGRAEPGEVLDAAQRQPAGERRASALLYAHLYLGLYAEARGDLDEARREIRSAVELGLDGYMADVARIHLDLLEGRLEGGPRAPG